MLALLRDASMAPVGRTRGWHRDSSLCCEATGGLSYCAASNHLTQPSQWREDGEINRPQLSQPGWRIHRRLRKSWPPFETDLLPTASAPVAEQPGLPVCRLRTSLHPAEHRVSTGMLALLRDASMAPVGRTRGWHRDSSLCCEATGGLSYRAASNHLTRLPQWREDGEISRPQ